MFPNPNPSRPGRPTTECFIEALASLMWGPKTVPEIAEATGCTYKVVNRWLRMLQASGCVYIAERRRPPVDPWADHASHGRRILVWALQETPFASTDAPESKDAVRSRARRAAIARRQQATA